MNCQVHNPAGLYSICLNFLCDNLSLVCDSVDIHLKSTSSSSLSSLPENNKNGKSISKSYKLKNKSIKFNQYVSENLLEKLCESGKLNDLTLGIFNSNQTCLRCVHIRNANLSKETLKSVLKQHRIDQLIINNVQFVASQANSSIVDQDLSSKSLNCTTSSNTSLNGLVVNNTTTNGTSMSCVMINDIIGCLSEWSLQNLKYLNVSRNAPLFGSILIDFKQLSSLSKLNVSYTCFNNQSLNTIAQDLANLEHLDISATKVNDLSALLHLKNKLKHLFMYNMRTHLNDDIIPIVCQLHQLQSLDLSCDLSSKIFADTILSLFDVNLLLDELCKANLKNLRYLDVSGKTLIQEEPLMNFLKAYTSQLKFIGLALTKANSFEAIKTNKSPLVVTGESTESQLIASLKFYKSRHVYVQKSLYHMFSLTKNTQQTRVDLLELIVELMRIHSKSQSVQLAATTCIFNLTQQNCYAQIPADLLTQIVNSVLINMQSFPNNVLKTNCLFILSNQNMLDNCIFNELECVRATLDCLVLYNEVALINQIILICARVASRARPKYRKGFKNLTDPKYAQKLISIVTSKLMNLSDDQILFCALDLIWILSSDNLDFCCNLITQNCLNIFCNLFEMFHENVDIHLKVMNSLFHLSEIGQIRPILFNHPIMNRVKESLFHFEFKMTFLAVGVFINLIVFLPESSWDWKNSSISSIGIYELEEKIEEIVDEWDQEHFASIRIFRNTLHSTETLIRMTNKPFVQIWSLWTVYCIVKSDPCCLAEEDKSKLIDSIKLTTNQAISIPRIRRLGSLIFNNL